LRQTSPAKLSALRVVSVKRDDRHSRAAEIPFARGDSMSTNQQNVIADALI
jgi:hypothetical protein